MKTKSILSLIFLCIVFIACVDESLCEVPLDGALLKQVLIEGELFYEYTYNSSGLIEVEKSKYHYSKHSYNNNNQLVQSDYYWDWRIASSSSYVLDEALKRTEWVSPENTEKSSSKFYIYNRIGRLEKSTSHRLNDDNSSYTTFSYNEYERIEQRTFFYENKASMYDNFFYDSVGNLVKEERYSVLEDGSLELRTTTEYELDNMHNPYLSFRGVLMPGQNTNPNNITKETYTLHGDVDDIVEPVQTTEYRYEYNRQGYPVKRDNTFEYIYY